MSDVGKREFCCSTTCYNSHTDDQPGFNQEVESFSVEALRIRRLSSEPSVFQSLLPASKSQLSLPVNCAIKNRSVGGGSSNYYTVRGYSMKTNEKFVSALGVLRDTSRVLLRGL
jgi:hypothetical protein